MMNRLCFFSLLWLSGIFGCADSYADERAFVTDDNGQKYFAFSVNQDTLSGAPDFSGLNHPITASDRLFIKNGHFYRIGPDLKPFTADDQRVKLYGINLSFSTNFPDHEQAVILAKRLRKLGFNAVRLHHMDTSPGNLTPPKSILSAGPFPTFNPAAVERLKFFIQALAKQGIYVNLNLHVGYQFDSKLDNIPAFDGNNTKESYGSSIQVYTPHLIDLQKEYAVKLIQALDLQHNPSLAMVEINNESSLLSSWTRKEWKIAVPAQFEPILQKQWQAWLIKRYGSLDNACKAWGTCAIVIGHQAALLTPDAPTGESSSLLTDFKNKVANKLKNYFKQPTEDRQPTAPEVKVQQDFLRFLIATDQAYYNTLRATIHQATDHLVPVTGTQMRYGGVLNFDSMHDMDYIDEHFYIDHPDYPSEDWSDYDWRIHNTSLDTASLRYALSNVFRRQQGKPFVISEYSMPLPNQQGAMIQPLLATIAAAQDWDGLFFFDYMDADTWANTASNFTLSGDWGKFALTGQSAQLFRNTLPPLADTLTIPVTQQARLNITSAAAWNGYDNYLESQFNLKPEIAFRHQISMQLSDTAAPVKSKADMPLPWIAANQTFTFTNSQLFILNASGAKGIWGFLPAAPVALDANISVQMQPHQRGFITMLMTPLDQQPLDSSSHFLLSLTGATTGTQPGSVPPRPKQLIHYRNSADWWTLEADPRFLNQPSGSRINTAPTWQEQTRVKLELSHQSAQSLTVYPLDGEGRRLAPLGSSDITRHGNTTTIYLQNEASSASLWYEFVVSSSAHK